MSDSTRAMVVTPEARTGLYYLSLFLWNGAAGAFLALWLTDKGISGGEIGWINSVPILLLLALNISVGRVADRARDWRTVIVVGSVASGILSGLLFVSQEFWPFLVAWTLACVPIGLAGPVVDAAALRMTRRNGSDFALIRVWGTIGYMIALAGAGWLFGRFGGDWFLPVMVGTAVIRGLLALWLPRFRAPENLVATVPALSARTLKQVMQPWFVFPLLAFAFVQSTHFVLQAFAALSWRDAGIDSTWTGLLLAAGAFSEAIVMLVFKRVAGNFTARRLIVISASVSTIRWAVMAVSPPVWVLLPLQLTHGLTFTFGYFGVMNFIANWTSEDVAAEAQSFAAVLQLGMIVLVLSGFGYLFEWFGGSAFAMASVLSAIGVGLVSVSMRMVTPKQE